MLLQSASRQDARGGTLMPGTMPGTSLSAGGDNGTSDAGIVCFPEDGPVIAGTQPGRACGP